MAMEMAFAALRVSRIGLLVGLAICVIGMATSSAPAVGSDVGRAGTGSADGSVAPPAIATMAQPLHSPGATYSHYWAGARYSGAVNNSSRQLSVNLTIPNAAPSSSEFYYILLSAFDSAGSYDQVGYSDDFGVWGFTYENAFYCGPGTPHLNADAYALDRGATYTFTMNLSGTGSLTFGVEHRSKYLDSVTVITHAKGFAVSGKYACGTSSFLDYTVYEETYYVAQKMPPFDFDFKSNQHDNLSVTTWTSMGSPMGGGTIRIVGADVLVENEAFKLAFAPGSRNAATVPLGASSYNFTVKVHRLFAGSNVSLSFPSGPSNISASATPSSGGPGYSATVHLTIGAVAAGKVQSITIMAKDGSGNYCYLTFALTVG